MTHDIELIRSLFTYDPETGKVFFKLRDFGPNPTPRQKQWLTMRPGTEAGFKKDGYVRVSMPNGKQLYAHQVAFAIVEGFIPIEIDHEDLNRSNNKWLNIRGANRERNAQNCVKRKTNKSGYKGVSWAKSNNCWRMDIQAKKQKFHSYHETAKEAYEAYCAKSAELHGNFGNVS